MKTTEFNIAIAGVGGQGVTLLARILGNAAIKEGLSVRIGEVYGASQRGGSVVSHIRFGENAFSPIIPNGRADVLLGLEVSEAARRIRALKPNGLVILNVYKIDPVEVKTGLSEYPSISRLVNAFKLITDQIITVNATDIATDLGDVRLSNIVLLGVLAGLSVLPISIKTLRQSIWGNVPLAMRNLNMKAFKIGFNLRNP